MRINNNIPAIMTHRSIRRADTALTRTMNRLSTGLRINTAADDAAGMAIAIKMRTQLANIDQAGDNSTHAVSMIQTAEGALTEVHSMLQRMRELAVQASNDTNTPADRSRIQAEIDNLIEEITSLSDRAEFNTIGLFTGIASRVSHSRIDDGLGNMVNANHISNLIFTSEAVGSGILSYRIDQVGLPAVTTLTGLPTNDNFVINDSGRININGIFMDVTAGETWGEVRARMNTDLLEPNGINFYYETGSGNESFLVTELAGANRQISISGTPALLAAIGLPAGTSTGSDAIISNIDLTGTRNSGLSWTSNGNQLNVLGANAEDIRFNLQVMFDGDGGFTFGDAATPIGTNLDMEFEFRDFGPLRLQIGPNSNMSMQVNIPRITAETLGLVMYAGGQQQLILNMKNLQGAQESIDILDRAINTISQTRSNLGAYQNRLESTVRSLQEASISTSGSLSRIQDTDMARESTLLSQWSVIQQAAMAMMAQANQRPQQILQLM